MRPERFRCFLAMAFSFYAILGAGVSGCGEGASEKFTPVVGKVTVKGTTLTTGSVTFHPDSAKANTTQQIPVGTLDDQGNYKLMSATKEGAPLGWYKVTVTAQAPIDPNNPYAPPKHLIDPKFSDVSTSGLAVEVVENPAPGAYDFQVSK